MLNYFSDVYQRNAWMELKSSIDSLIKEINAANIGKITKKLLYKNIVRGKGLLCTSIMQAQMDSINRTQVYATLVALINAKVVLMFLTHIYNIIL